MREDIVNHAPVYKYFVAAADDLKQACDAANITSGLEPIDMINKEVLNRWTAMNHVVDEKQHKLETTQKQLQSYKEHLDRMSDLLERTEEVMKQQASAGVDLDQARTNRDTLMVSNSSS